jgi:hypothetical protein
MILANLIGRHKNIEQKTSPKENFVCCVFLLRLGLLKIAEA